MAKTLSMFLFKKKGKIRTLCNVHLIGIYSGKFVFLENDNEPMTAKNISFPAKRCAGALTCQVK